MKNLLLSMGFIVLALPGMAVDHVTLMLDWFVNPDHAAIIVAKQKGFFATQGLAVDIKEPSDAAVPPKMVAAGKVDIAVSYQPTLYLSIDHGLPVSRISTLIATPLNALVVRKDSNINSIADLKGRKIGYSSPFSDQVVLKTMLQTGDLALKDVKLINVDFALVPALMSRQVDAVIGAFRNIELNAMAAQQVPGRAFYVEEHGLPAYDELIIIANNKDRNAVKYARFNAALEAATQYILNHPKAAFKVYASYKKGLGGASHQTEWTATLPRLALRPGALDTERYIRYGQFMKKNGLIKTLPELADYAIQPVNR